MNTQPFLFGAGWIEVRDGNDTVRAIFDRHYSRYFYADDPTVVAKLEGGPDDY